MSILKKNIDKEKTKDTSFLGIHFPKEDAIFLSLYSLSTGESKSTIIKSFLNSWLEEKRKTITVEKLIEDTAIRAYQIWENPDGKRTNFQTFKKLLKNELRYRGLNIRTINKILNIIIDEKNKND